MSNLTVFSVYLTSLAFQKSRVYPSMSGPESANRARWWGLVVCGSCAIGGLIYRSLQRALHSAKAQKHRTRQRYPLVASHQLVFEDVAYGPHPEQRLDLYVPRLQLGMGLEPRPSTSESVAVPLVVFIHGGLWCFGDKDEGYLIGRCLSLPPTLRNCGYGCVCGPTAAGGGEEDGGCCSPALTSELGPCVVASVNYRRSQMGTTGAESDSRIVHPSHTEDVTLALAWLASRLTSRHTCAELGFGLLSVDIDRVAFVGHSVGAHMAGLLCLSDSPSLSFWRAGDLDGDADAGVGAPGTWRLRVRGVVGVQGIYDTLQFCREKPEWAAIVRAAMPEDQRLWSSPQQCVPPPTRREQGQYLDQDGKGEGRLAWLLVHSLQDPWVESLQSLSFCAALRAAGFRADVCLLPSGGSHDAALQLIGRRERGGHGGELLDCRDLDQCEAIPPSQSCTTQVLRFLASVLSPRAACDGAAH